MERKRSSRDWESNKDRLARLSKRETYGMFEPSLVADVPQREIERLAFLRGGGSAGRAPHVHFKKACLLTWPELQTSWNPWLESMIWSLCQTVHIEEVGGSITRSVAWTGCASAGKTYASGLFALNWWVISPQNSIVILTSTSKEMLRKRVWSVIRSLTDSAVDVDSGQRIVIPGIIMESKTSIQVSRQDDKHAIFSMAVAHGETAKAVSAMKGMHAERMLLVVDECNGTPESIFNVIPNLRKGCQDFTVLFIGNAISRLDPHGRVCEPRDGWNTVDVETEQWPTKGVEEWHIPPGICMHYDGHASPNVKNGETRWPFIYTVADYETSKRKIIRDLGWWSNDRGFWAGEGVVNTVLTEQLLERCKAYDRPPWDIEPTPLAFLDPGFGGDACILQFGHVGLVDGRHTLILDDPHVINPVDSVLDAEYAISKQVIAACTARDVQPENFGLDATGIGRGCASVIANEWSPAIQRVEWGGKSSDRPASEDDPRPGHEVYFNRVTELWYGVKQLVEAQQLKGMYRDAAIQFCSREYEMVSRRYRVLEKAQVKQVIGRSPDHADAIAGLAWIARGLGVGGGLGPNTKWKPHIFNEEVYSEETAYAEEDSWNT